MASNTLLDTIEPDEPSAPRTPSGNINAAPKNAKPQVVLTPTALGSEQMASSSLDAELGLARIFRQSAHPMVLFCLFFFRIAAIALYLLSGFFINNYVVSTVVVVVLLAMDFWNCRNVAGRRLVGLRFWNQVDEDGESFWVFESRDPSRPANPLDSKMFWIALYAFPVLWLVILFFSFVRFNLEFIPIVILALISNVTNCIGFSYADRDAKQRWASGVASAGWNMGLGGFGGTIMTGVMKNSVGRVFGQ